MNEPPVLDVDGLQVGFRDRTTIVEEVTLQLRRGEALGIVGESGSGKTTLALALLGFTRPGVHVLAGRVRVAGEDVTRGDRKVRGKLISYVPQDPATALNPSMRVGDAVRDMLTAHRPGQVTASRVGDALGRVSLPSDARFARRYPHELSGGQQQRLALAFALVCEPAVVVLDEPTTGLDVVTQARILSEVRRLRQETGVAVVYVSHDLAAVGSSVDRIAVIYAGRFVEIGPAAAVLGRPRHPYAAGLIGAVPDHDIPRRVRGIPGVAAGVGRERTGGCSFAPRCSLRLPACLERVPDLLVVGEGHAARCIEWERTTPVVAEARATSRPGSAEPLLEVDRLQAVHRVHRGTDVVAAQAVSFSVAPGECVALVGESGSGKTTIARCIAGLHALSGGEIRYRGTPVPALAHARSRDLRGRIAIVFQNPYDSLNPRHRVRDIVARPARQLDSLSRHDANARAEELLARVGMAPATAGRYPAELSGGERQRVAIARALSAEPELLVCDEVTSALDVSVQAAVLELLEELRLTLGLAVVFITHDLGVVASIADRVLVLERGILRESGRVEQVLAAPVAVYTRTLLAAAARMPRDDAVAPERSDR